jgi:hypothetical protein
MTDSFNLHSLEAWQASWPEATKALCLCQNLPAVSRVRLETLVWNLACRVDNIELPAEFAPLLELLSPIKTLVHTEVRIPYQNPDLKNVALALKEAPIELLAKAIAVGDLLQEWGGQGIALLLKERPALEVLEAMLLAVSHFKKLHPDWASGGWNTEELGGMLLNHTGSWVQLRQYFKMHPPKEDALSELSSLLCSLDPPLQNMLCMVFPKQSDWAESAAASWLDRQQQGLRDFSGYLLLSCQILESTASAMLEAIPASNYYSLIKCLPDIAYEHPATLQPFLARWLEQLASNPSSTPFLQTVFLFEALDPLLTTALTHPIIGPVIKAHFLENPERAILSLAPCLVGRNRQQAAGAALMVGLCRAHPEVVRKLLPRLDPKAAAKASALLLDRLEEAPVELLPEVLASPPWRKAREPWPTLPGYKQDEIALHAACSRNRPLANRSGEAWFSTPERQRLLLNLLVGGCADRGLVLGCYRAVVAEAGTVQVGERERELLAQLLSVDPLLECPDQPPSLPKWVEAKTLPRARLTSGQPLSLAHQQTLLEMLAFLPYAGDYAGLELVLHSLEPASLEELGLELAGRWDGQGPGTWALFAAGHLGSDATVRKLATKIRLWLKDGKINMALAGIDSIGILARNPRYARSALLHLANFSDRASLPALADAADMHVRKLAQQEGLSEEELGDRLTPTLELRADGTTTLDFGPRQLEVRFDSTLKPQLFQQGKLLKSIPRTQPEDDPSLALESQSRWQSIKGDGAAILTRVRFRLEAAMRQGRRWRLGLFKNLIVEHPLIGLLARKLVWGAWSGARVQAFRIAEDSSFADASDEFFEPGEFARISLLHPLEISQLAGWQQIFNDYALLQPFKQLNRPCYRFKAEEAGQQSLVDLPEGAMGFPMLKGILENRGWSLESSRRIFNTFQRTERGHRATIHFDPPLWGKGAPDFEVTLQGAQVDTRIRQVHPVVYSELRMDLLLFGASEFLKDKQP